MKTKKYIQKQFLIFILLFIPILLSQSYITHADTQLYPQKIGLFETLFAWDIVVIGDIAYVGGNEEGLQLIDVSDPRNPVELGQLDLGVTHGIDVHNGIAYLSDYNNGLQIINVSNPLNPTKISDFHDGGHVFDVFAVGDLVYI